MNIYPHSIIIFPQTFQPKRVSFPPNKSRNNKDIIRLGLRKKQNQRDFLNYPPSFLPEAKPNFSLIDIPYYY